MGWERSAKAVPQRWLAQSGSEHGLGHVADPGHAYAGSWDIFDESVLFSAVDLVILCGSNQPRPDRGAVKQSAHRRFNIDRLDAHDTNLPHMLLSSVQIEVGLYPSWGVIPTRIPSPFTRERPMSSNITHCVGVGLGFSRKFRAPADRKSGDESRRWH